MNVHLPEVHQRVHDIVPAVAHLPFALPDMLHQVRMRELARILLMGPVNDINHRLDFLLPAQKFNRLRHFQIDLAHLFALAQVSQRRLPF